MKSKNEKVNILLKDSKTSILKISFALLSSSVVFYAVYLLLDASGGFIRIISAVVYFFVKIMLKFFFLMIINTLPFILSPCVIYLAACLFIKRKFLRYYIFLLLFSFYIIWFIKFVLHTDFLIAGHLLKITEILAAFVQIYIFLLLIMPSSMSGILASVFFIFKSILVFILPDLPFRFDDFGIIIALFLFTFFYLNNIVLLVKKAGNLLLKINFIRVVSGIPGGSFNEHRKNDQRKKGLILSFSGIFLMSFDALLIRLASVSGWNVAFYRGLFIFLVLGTVFLINNKKQSASVIKSGGLPLLFSGFLWGLSGFFFVLGVKMTVVANALVFLSISPVIAALLSLFILREFIPLRTWSAIFISIAGVVIIVLGDLGSGNMTGNIFALLAPFCLAFNLTHLRKHPDISRTAAVCIGGFITALISLPLASPLTVPLQGMIYLMLLGLLVIPFSQFLLSLGSKYIPSPEVSLVMVNETWLGSVWVWVFINEIPSSNTFAGGSLILSAMIINSVISMRKI